jgi:hypothetical protein
MGPVFALADLERAPCASGLIATHLPRGCHRDLILRLSVRMVQRWLLAQSDALAEFLKVSEALVPSRPDEEENPKRTVVNLARKSRSRAIRTDLVPEQGSSGVVGKGYTTRMEEFVRDHWDPLQAQGKSDSVRRALAALSAGLRAGGPSRGTQA